MNPIQLIQATLILTFLFMLQGCLDAAVTGAQVAYNHNHIQKTMTDQYITTQAYRKLYRDTRQFDDSNIAVATFHQKLLLTGQVSSSQKRLAAEQIVNTIPNVQRVYNLTEITSPTTPLIRASDTWITTKIKTKLIAMNDIDPDQVKVVTENGTVYLMGMVLPEQADIAVDVARTTDGVQNVVKVFTYLRISQS